MPSVAIRHSMPHQPVVRLPVPFTGSISLASLASDIEPRVFGVVGRLWRKPEAKDDEGADEASSGDYPPLPEQPGKEDCHRYSQEERKQAIARHPEDDVGLSIERRRADRLAAAVEQISAIKLRAVFNVLESVFPKRVAAGDGRDHVEVLGWRRRRRGPFECGRIPWV